MNNEDYEEYWDEDDDEETLNVYDAADIYFSKGMDEDYRFGYSHQELVEAFNQQ